ncbi:MAG: ammonia-forming cytochrome c nitrite reductase subunit c552 [Nitrospinae bacterium]|nr:ammonia-forming cytochrome c nitrite reductase subunit c552 [Nitrospinota bacterium]
MKKIVLPLLFAAFCLFATFSAQSTEAKEKNQCVECHQSINDGSIVQKEYNDYKKSNHAQKGVTCDKCHGGYADQKDKEIAHRGVRPANDRESLVHFQKIPSTCGKCHRAEEDAFISSKHFKKLSTSGKGPNCVTCHTPKKARILTSEVVRFLCRECHNKDSSYTSNKLTSIPADAQNTLTLFEKTTLNADWLGEYLSLATKTKDVSSQQKQYQDLKRKVKRAKVDWHHFKIYDTQVTLRELLHEAEDIKESIK